MAKHDENQAWWLAPQAAATLLQADPTQGLGQAEAVARLAQWGPNELRPKARRSLLRQYLSRFRNPLVLILLAASTVSALSGEIANFAIIVAIILISVTLDFVQEYRANASAEHLRRSVSQRARVLRDGAVQELPADQIVPGDLILMSAGDLIPADGLVLQAQDLFIKQSLLTGETFPVEKHSVPVVGTDDDLQKATNALFMGTSVISGSGRMRVVRTGTRTFLGDIAERISTTPEPTSFEIGTRRFGLLIMRLTVLMVLFVLFVNLFDHKPWLESFLFAVALAVGLTPELLPMVVSVTLSQGAIRMARQNMIVKRLSAIQDLGSMDVLCTDKTGTLTESRIRLERGVDALGAPSARVQELAYLNSFFETGLKSPLDEAILAGTKPDVSVWTKLDEVPFDFERRRVSVLIENGERRWLVVKGAPEEMLGLCTRYEAGSEGKELPLDEAAGALIRDHYRRLEQDGLRALGIAWREVPKDHPHAVVGDESGLSLAGFVAFLDPPKASAATAMAALTQLGVTIKVVTGDSELVTRHVCADLGMPVTEVLLGREIAAMDDAALQVRAERCNLFCRVNPAQKERVIQALRARGHVVGYLGDGINDAPSLHAADVGLSVDSAVDVAKEAADMILLRQDLQVLAEAVREGRRTFGNIMKYILMGTSSNFGNMFSMAGAALFLPFLPMLPTQILLNNMLYDLSELPIPFDEVDEQDVRTPRVMDMSFLRNFMLVLGPISSAFDFLTFFLLLKVLHADEKLFQTGWFVESLCTQVLVIFVIRTRGSFLRSRPHPLLLATSLLVVALAIALPFTALGRFFGFVPPPPLFFAMLVGMVLSYLLAAEAAKRWFYRRLARGA